MGPNFTLARLLPFTSEFATSNNAYWHAFAVGVMNTLRVAVIGIVLSTVIGTLLGWLAGVYLLSALFGWWQGYLMAEVAQRQARARRHSFASR